MLLNMERFFNLILIGLFTASINAESISSSSASSSASSSSDSTNAYSSAYAESDVSEENSPICNENEVYDECPVLCPPKRCDVDERVIRCKAPPKVGDPECKPGCRCIQDYYKNDENVCVPKNKCPLKCKDNEIFDLCPPKCPSQDCGVDPALILCAPSPKIGDPECEPSCRCKDGFNRDDFGNCIPKEKCPPKPSVVCGPDEQYSSCVNGGCGRWNCSQPGIICIDLIEGACREGCRCKEKYLRADNGTCIPENQCPSICNENEVYDECPALCPPKRCDVDERIIRCKAPPKVGDPECKPGCRCIKDYYKNDENVCVPKNKCPLKCKDNEIFDLCPPKCPSQDCGVDPALILCAPSPKIGDPECEPSCRCKDGFNRDDFGNCIPKEKCPPKPSVVCGPDEQYSSCVNGGCGRWNCSQPGIICIDLIEGACREGCRCKEKYLRADNGTCIPENQCPLKCYRQNEVPGCEDKCSPQTCESIGKYYNCPLKPVNPPCKPVCRCKPGYYRNKIGDCISKTDCLKCTGPHEYFSCGQQCDNECYNLSKQNQTSCPYVNIVCNKKCYCESGYARNNRKICIPFAKCPPEIETKRCDSI